MRHVADVGTAPARDGEAPWLLDSPFNDWAARVRSFSRSAARELRSEGDTCFFVFRGGAEVRVEGGSRDLPCGATLFVPAGEGVEILGRPEARVLEIVARKPEPGAKGTVKILPLDESRFEGRGFAYQTIVDRAGGSTGMKLNVLRVEPGSGSPDFHIHAFDQVYFILEGRMHIDIGKRSYVAGPESLVYMPAGIVHRNYNPGPDVERHVSILVPEPCEGAVFDYAVDIHEREAKLMTVAQVAAREASA